MKKQYILKRYNDYDDNIKAYMEFIINSIVEQYNDIPDTFIISLDMLAQNLSIMNDAYNNMKDNGLCDKDKYHNVTKANAYTNTFFTAQTRVSNILGQFGFTPSSKAKIKKDKEDVNIQSFLDELTA